MARPMRIVSPWASADDRSDATGTFSSLAAASKVNKTVGIRHLPSGGALPCNKRPFSASFCVVLWDARAALNPANDAPL
jgi:hypothetical protein